MKLYFQKNCIGIFYISYEPLKLDEKIKILIFLGPKTCAITQKLWVQSSNVKSSKVNFSYLTFTCKRNFYFIPKNLACRPMLKNWGKSGQLAPHSIFCKFYCQCNFTLKKIEFWYQFWNESLAKKKTSDIRFFGFILQINATDKLWPFSYLIRKSFSLISKNKVKSTLEKYGTILVRAD